MRASVDTRRCHKTGFSTIEALIALLVVSGGALAIGHFSGVLMRHAEVARHRTEATLLAQAKLDELRRFTQLLGGTGSYAALEGNSDAPEAASNTRFERRWQVSGTGADTQRRLDVQIDWTDRDGQADPAGVRLVALVARAEPADAARAALWPTEPHAASRALGRSLDIPIPATRLSGANRGRSVLRWGGASAGHLVFDDANGVVIAQCESAPVDGTDIAAACRPIDGLLLSGHLTGPNALTAIDIVIEQPQHLVATPECHIDNAVGPDGQLIAGVRAYRCLMRPGDHDGNAGTPRVWSGRAVVSPQPVGTEVVCRYTRAPRAPLVTAGTAGTADDPQAVRNADHPSVYTRVSRSLAHQNFALIADGACPEGSEPHQPG